MKHPELQLEIDPGEVPAGERRRARVPWTMLPTVLAIAVMMGGWVANWATNAAEIRSMDQRLASIEKNYVPTALLEERTKRIEDGQENTQRRLDELRNDIQRMSDQMEAIPRITRYVYREKSKAE